MRQPPSLLLWPTQEGQENSVVQDRIFMKDVSLGKEKKFITLVVKLHIEALVMLANDITNILKCYCFLGRHFKLTAVQILSKQFFISDAINCDRVSVLFLLCATLFPGKKDAAIG